MTRRVYHAALLFSVIALLAAAACGGAYGKAIERGDKYAAAGQWDQAVAEYQRAIEIDPDKPDARIKLDQVRAKQAGEHLERARALEARGEFAQALAAAQQAARLQPDNPTAQGELTRLTDVVLARAKALIDGDKLQQAFALTTLVLQGAPRHPKARRMDRTVRAELAARSYERAEAYVANNQLGNGLVELALSMTYRPNFPEAKLQFGRVKVALQEQLMFIVTLPPFGGSGKNAFVSRALSPTVLNQALDERLLIRVARRRGAAASTSGLDLTGSFSGYSFRRGKRDERRSCDYVCGTDTKPNPERARIERDLSSSEQSLARADQDVARAEQKVLQHEREVANLQRNVDREQQDVDRARTEHDRCMERAKPDDNRPCSSQKSRLESEQRSLDSARDRMRYPRDRLDSARKDLNRERDDRSRAQQEVARKRERLRETPTTLKIDRYCAFDYRVALHTVRSQVTMTLTVARTGDDAPIVKAEPFKYQARRQDVTHRAYPGRCGAVASSDPLQLPNEEQLRNELLKSVVKDMRGKILASYDSYRQRYLAVARKHEAAGLNEEAVEAYVRYVLTGPHALKDAGAIGKFLSTTRGFGKLESLWSL